MMPEPLSQVERVTISKGAVAEARADFLPAPLTFTFHEPVGVLMTIHPDGTIERGPAFTTEDEASLHFWDALERFAWDAWDTAVRRQEGGAK